MTVPDDDNALYAPDHVMATWKEENIRCFAIWGRTDIIRAEVVGGRVVLAPQRSSGHKALVAALGLNEASE